MSETYRDFNQRLSVIKESLGPFSEVLVTGRDYVEAHGILGAQNATAIQERLREHLTDPQIDLASELAFLQNSAAHMFAVQESLATSNPRLAGYIGEYFQCLEAWGHSAHLYEVAQQLDRNIPTAGLALLLQNDNLGCRTILLRNQNDSVSIAHNEEWPLNYGSRVRSNILNRWDIGSSSIVKSYTYGGYPEVLPGSAFSFSDKGVQACDFLQISPNMNGGFMANAAGWILWRDSDPQNAENILQSLVPFADGLAANFAYLGPGGKPEGKFVEFGANDVVVQKLGKNPGDYLTHTNCLAFGSRSYASMTNSHTDEETSERIERYEKRKALLDKTMRRGSVTVEDGSGYLRRVLAMRVGHDSDVSSANVNVKAVVSGTVSVGKMVVGCSSGPSVKNDSNVLTYEFPANA